MRNKSTLHLCPVCGGKGKIEISDTRKAFGYKVASARVARGLTQEEVALGLGVTRTSITNLEAGRQNLPLDKVYSLAEILKVEARDLL
jgi:transcriptional regulator with XRE-family HTH domain